MNFFDLHCDTPFECFTKKEDFYKNSLAVSGEKGKYFENWTQTFAVWIKDDAENPFSLYLKILNDFKEKLKDKPENLSPVFAVEGGAVLENNSDRLFNLKEDGIKFLTLTWNGENAIAGGIKSNKGLTDFGKTVIHKTNRLKIGCDLSHLNQKSFYSAIEISNYPLATHSNCKEICNHPRNLSVEQIRLIAEKGGIIGLCFYPEFLGNNDVYEMLYRNIFTLCEQGFENHIAIGSDFDGAVMDEKLNTLSKIPFLYEYLKEKNLEKDLLDKLFYKNANNYIAKFS